MNISSINNTLNSTNCSFSTTDSLSEEENTEEFLILNEEYSYSEPGNIIPNFWFKKIVDEKGRPDLTAITLLSEIFALYRFSNSSPSCSFLANRFCDETILVGKTLRTSYDYFYRKFLIRKEKARRGFMRLEELEIITRDVCNISLGEKVRCNKLMITLNQEFFISCFRNPELDVRALKKDILVSSSPKEALNEINIDNNRENEVAISDNTEIQSMQISYHPICNKNKNIKDRSIKSKFLQNSFFKKDERDKHIQHRYTPAPVQLKTPVLQLKDFYPLSASDASHLQSYSGREFSLNAMNEILLDMSKRVKDRWFKSKKGFLSYMSLVFKHEMRDAVKVSNIGFKIKSNQTSEEVTARMQEKFLAETEYNLQVSPEWHLKKKLCSVLERETAYNLLSSYKHCRIDGNEIEIHLSKQIELTSTDRNIILNQVKASHNSIDIITGKIVDISKLKVVMPGSLNKAKSTKSEGQGDLPPGIWGSIRQALINYYEKDGEGIDRAWFSKIDPEIDENQKTIKLKTPNEFFKNWINQNYASVLERIVGNHEYEYVIS